jgi:hypothetical protein
LHSTFFTEKDEHNTDFKSISTLDEAAGHIMDHVIKEAIENRFNPSKQKI